jgi:hypothetical protein
MQMPGEGLWGLEYLQTTTCNAQKIQSKDG